MMESPGFRVLLVVSLLLPLQHGVDSLSRTEFLHRLLEGYDSRVPPNFDTDTATVVVFDILIGSFDSISENTMDYDMTLFLRQRWTDERLNFTHLADDEQIMLDARMAESLWLPDIYFANEKKAYFHDVMIPNKFIRLHRNGTIYYSARISLTLSCPMKLHKFPMDKQICSIQMESYAYPTDHLQFVWRGGNPIEMPNDLELPQFKLKDWSWQDCTKTYNTGQFTCLQVDFVLNRDMGYYVIQAYIPSTLVVILSWVSFWINIDAVPARISLGVLTVLTMTTQATGIRQSLPRVSYIKAIDVWMSTCLIFVFAALLEFAIVNVHTRKEVRRLATIRKARNSQKGKQDQEKKAEKALNAKPALATMAYSVCQMAENVAGTEDTASPNGAAEMTKLLADAEKRRTARNCDKYSRRLFPAVFVLFNLIYWPTYFLWEQL